MLKAPETGKCVWPGSSASEDYDFESDHGLCLRFCLERLVTIFSQTIGRLRATAMLQYSWITSHALNLVFTMLFTYKTVTSEPSTTLYFMASAASASTYVLVTYRHVLLLHYSHKRITNTNTAIHFENPFSIIIRSENTILLAMSVLGTISNRSCFKLFSSAIYSFMNLITYSIVDAFPSSTLTKAVNPLFNYLEKDLLVAASTFDYFVMLVYAKDAWFYHRYSHLAIYTLLWCLRLDSSLVCKTSMHNLFEMVYYILSRNNLGGVSHLKNIESFLLESRPPDPKQTFQTLPPPVTKKDRVASLEFDSFSVENDS